MKQSFLKIIFLLVKLFHNFDSIRFIETTSLIGYTVKVTNDCFYFFNKLRISLSFL